MIKKIYPMLVSLFLLTSPVFTQQTNTGTNTNNSGYLQNFYDQEKESDAKKIKPPSPFWATVKIIFYTGIFGVGAYFLVRFIIAKGSLPATEDSEVIETLLNKPMGMGAFIQIVKVGPVYYLLSLSGDGIRLIDRIDDRETIDYIELNKEKFKPKETKFFDILSYLPKSKVLDKFDFLKNQKDRLKKM